MSSLHIPQIYNCFNLRGNSIKFKLYLYLFNNIILCTVNFISLPRVSYCRKWSEREQKAVIEDVCGGGHRAMNNANYLSHWALPSWAREKPWHLCLRIRLRNLTKVSNFRFWISSSPQTTFSHLCNGFTSTPLQQSKCNAKPTVKKKKKKRYAERACGVG